MAYILVYLVSWGMEDKKMTANLQLGQGDMNYKLKSSVINSNGDLKKYFSFMYKMEKF